MIIHIASKIYIRICFFRKKSLLLDLNVTPGLHNKTELRGSVWNNNVQYLLHNSVSFKLIAIQENCFLIKKLKAALQVNFGPSLTFKPFRVAFEGYGFALDFNRSLQSLFKTFLPRPYWVTWTWTRIALVSTVSPMPGSLGTF